MTAVVNVVVQLSTLTGLLNETGTGTSGWIEGLGPVPGSTIRDLIRDLLNGSREATTKTGWRVVACDDTTGTPAAA